MSPPENTTIAASSSGIVAGPAMFLGSNVSVRNTVDGFNTKALPITTESILNVKNGINVNVNGAGAGKSSLVINSSGDVDTVGAIHTVGSITTAGSLNSSSLNIINSSGAQTCRQSPSCSRKPWPRSDPPRPSGRTAVPRPSSARSLAGFRACGPRPQVVRVTRRQMDQNPVLFADSYNPDRPSYLPC